MEDLLADVSRSADPNKLSHPLNTHLYRPGFGTSQEVNARGSLASAAQHEGRAPAAILQNSVTPRSAGSTCPRMLQPLRPHKRMSLPALKPGGASGFAPVTPRCSFGSLANRTKQLPPPSRGLPSFNAGPQMQPEGASRVSLLQPRRTSKPCRDPSSTNCSLEETSQGMVRDPGSAKILIPLSRSCLPKPKIP